MAKTPRIGPQWVIGWREWLALPDLGVERIKCKIDTGARSSALHAFDIEPFKREGKTWVRFKVHPLQRNQRLVVAAAAPLSDERTVRNSGGHAELRPVIRTAAGLPGRTWSIELTLTNRDEMGFRMLLGRQALQQGFLIDAGRSFLTGRSVTTPAGKGRRRAKP